MSNSNDVLRALATLAENGISLSKDQTAALEEMRAAALTDAARTIFEAKLSIEDDGEKADAAAEWTTEMFALAADLTAALTPKKRESVTRGMPFVRQFAIDTPHGALSVKLHSESE